MQHNQHIIIDLHAYESSPQSEYHPWLAAQIKSKGMQIIQPELPGGVYADFKKWYSILEDTYTKVVESHPETIYFTGRSLGTWPILHFAQDFRLDKVVLVCPVSQIAFERKEFRERFDAWNKEALPVLDRFVTNNPVDYSKIRKNIKELVICLSDNDPNINYELVKPFYQEVLPDAKIITFPNAGHFNATSDKGYRSFIEFPELLTELTLSCGK